MNMSRQKLTITFLGTGTSQGIPVINCDCGVCRSSNPHNKRLRTSITVRSELCHILVDTTTDLRQQLLRNPIRQLDAVLYTHAHADHICGIDDLRPFNFIAKKKIPVYGNKATLQRLTQVFDYAFATGELNPGVPNLEANEINNVIRIKDLEIIPLELWHGPSIVLGYRINNFAYCTDVNKIPDNTFKLMTGLDVLVLDALRPWPHPTHFSLDEAISIAKTIGAKKTYFVHMSHDIDQAVLGPELPEEMYFAYDGLSFAV